MPRTRSGQSYNSMEQGSHNPNLPDPNPNPPDTNTNPDLNTNPTHLPHLFQQQIDQMSQTLDAVIRRVDIMEERRRYEGGRMYRGEQRAPWRREWIDESDQEWDEVEQLGGERRRGPRFVPKREPPPRRPGAVEPPPRREPLDELTRKMKVDVQDFSGRLDPDAFHDWIVSLEDYFDWFLVSEERKVRFVQIKLKSPARAWWSSVEEQLRRSHQAPVSEWEEMRDRKSVV